MSGSLLLAAETDGPLSEEGRVRALEQAVGDALLKRSAWARAVPVLLGLSDWTGAPDSLRSWLPIGDEPFGEQELMELLDGVGVGVVPRQVPAAGEPVRRGTLLIGPRGAAVWQRGDSGVAGWHDGAELVDLHSVGTPMRCMELARQSSGWPHQAQPRWVANWLARTREEWLRLLGVSLLVNLLMLGVSLFTMLAYNVLIPTGGMSSLWSLGAAAIGVAVAASWLRWQRGRMLLALGAQSAQRLTTAVLQKLLALPRDAAQRPGLVGNLSRMRTFEGLRELISGGVGSSLVDLPFVLIFLAAIAWMGGWIALVPVLGLLAFLVAHVVLAPELKLLSVRVGALSVQLQDVVATLTEHQRTAHGNAPSRALQRRLDALCVEVAQANRDMAVGNAKLQFVAQALTQLTVLSTMGVGAWLVMNAQMSTGGLIAAMMLIWRVTSPAQSLLSSGVSLGQTMDSLRQLDRLMASTGEAAGSHGRLPLAPSSAALGLQRLYYRPVPDREPVLNGVSLEVPAGSRVAVIGPNGAGKSSLLQAILGLTQLQGGRVLVDGTDVRQFDPVTLRQWAGYLPQEPSPMLLNVHDRICAGRSSIRRSDVLEQLESLGGSQWWQWVGADDAAAALAMPMDLPADSPEGLRAHQLVGLARALVGDPPLVILDEPVPVGDAELLCRLEQALERIKGRSTVVIATHRAELIARCDLAAVMDRGALLHFGPLAPASAPLTESISVTP